MRLSCLLWLIGICFSMVSVASEGLVEKRIPVEGLLAESQIVVDHWGVPHIYASNAHDAFFAQGWNAARDRLWQIDMWRRSGLGELSAALGPSHVAQDRAIRLFTYRGDMEKEWASYGRDAKQETEAFVAGINSYVAAVRSKSAPMPMEFTLLGYEPAFWKADDVVRVRNHGLAGNASIQAMRARLACKEKSIEAAALVYKISPPWTPIVPEALDLCSIPPDVLDQYQLGQMPMPASLDEVSPGAVGADRKLRASNELVHHSQGSNNWVISPAKSATGRPILANDPHRSLEVPSLRYVAHLVAPDLDVIGAGEPALPGIAIGHNEHIAFGLTVFPIAQEDLYVYDTDPQNPNEYRYKSGWESMRVQPETISVRGGADVQTQLKFTRHGPVVLEDLEHHRVYAIRATWLDVGGAPYFASMGYLRARDMQQFRSALKRWGEPGENQIYADTEGNIGWFPAGFTPIRSNSDGLLPLPGDGRYEWGGYLDRDLLPSEIDPSRGYIATANQMSLPADYPYAQRRVAFTLWADEFRFARISEVLKGLPKVSLEASQNLQNDYLSLPARHLIRVLRTIKTPQQELGSVVQWLEQWDGQITAASAQAALFEIWSSHHLIPKVISQAAHVSIDTARGLVGLTIPAPVVDLMEHPDERLGPHPNVARDDLMLQTLADALQETKQRLGPDRSTWRWGDLATVMFSHPLSALVEEPLRRKLNVGPQPKSGDGDVVSVAAFVRSKTFRPQIGASFRMVLDVGHWDDSVAVNTPGQSGDPSSPHYRDLFPLWIQGGYFQLAYSRAAVERVAERKIFLEPAASHSATQGVALH